MPILFANDIDINGHKVINLADGTAPADAVNRDQLDDNSAFDIQRANHTGTQLASTISNFTAAVQAIEWASMVDPTGPVNLNSQKIENLADGTASSDAINLGQLNAAVSGIAGGLAFKGVVEVVHLANVNTANPGTSTFDGQTITSGQVVLLDGQTTGAQDGPWTFNGSASAMTRPANWDTDPEAVVGSFWVVARGTQADKIAIMTNDTFDLGTDEPEFIFIGVGGGADDDASFSQNVGTGSAGPYTITHNLGTVDVHVTVRELAGDYMVLVSWKPTSINAISIEPDETWATNSHRVVISAVV